MNEKEWKLVGSKWRIDIALPAEDIVPQSAIDKYKGVSTETPDELFAHVQNRRFQRNADWSLDQIVGMYLTALANGATFAQVDASANFNYGVSFGFIFAVWTILNGLAI